MKTLKGWVLCSAVVLGVAARCDAQGTIAFNNLGNTTGLVSINYGSGWGLLNEDVNFALVAGPNGAALQLIHEWLLSDNSAKGISVGGGHFADPSGGVFAIPGVPAGASAIVEVLAWAGNYDRLIDASAAGLPTGNVVFRNPTGGNGTPASSLVGMPALEMTWIPEPSSLTLALVGAVAWRLSRRGKVPKQAGAPPRGGIAGPGGA